MAKPPARSGSELHFEKIETSLLAGGLEGDAEGRKRQLGTRLAAFRAMRNMTQGELAKRLNKSRTTVNQYEMGNIVPPLSMIDELAGALEVDPADLAYGRVSQITKATVTYRASTHAGDDLFITVPPNIGKRLELDGKAGSILELDSDAPHFGLRRSDLLIVDGTQTKVRGDGRLYAVVNEAGGLSLIKPDVQLEYNATVMRVTLGNGQASEVRGDRLKVVGLVKASLKFE